MPARPHGPRIAIIGGGIGGLAAAAFLRRAGLTATVHEQAPVLTEVGAWLVVAPNAVRLLRRLGVMDAFLRRAVALEWGWEFRRWADGGVLSVERLTDVCEQLYGERTYVIHRSDLLGTVRSAVPGAWIRLGERCTSVEATPDDVLLDFADGSHAEADVVIGADGVHSVVCGALAGRRRPEYSGLCAFAPSCPLTPHRPCPSGRRRRSGSGPAGTSCTTRSAAAAPSTSSPSRPPGTTPTSPGVRRPPPRSSMPSSPTGTPG